MIYPLDRRFNYAWKQGEAQHNEVPNGQSSTQRQRRRYVQDDKGMGRIFCRRAESVKTARREDLEPAKRGSVPGRTHTPGPLVPAKAILYFHRLDTPVPQAQTWFM
jgi:hypothetical protein